MEQVKFTNSAVSKAFEKQIKTIEDRGEKQIKAMEEHEKPDKQKEILYKLAVEKAGEIEQLYNNVDFENLICHFKWPTKVIDFNDFICAGTLFDEKKYKK